MRMESGVECAEAFVSQIGRRRAVDFPVKR
jgi:hypothetical protein